MYRKYRSVRYRYESLYRYRRYRYPCRTELTEVSGTSNTGGIYHRYASVRTVPNTPLDIIVLPYVQRAQQCKRHTAASEPVQRAGRQHITGGDTAELYKYVV